MSRTRDKRKPRGRQAGQDQSAAPTTADRQDGPSNADDGAEAVSGPDDELDSEDIAQQEDNGEDRDEDEEGEDEWDEDEEWEEDEDEDERDDEDEDEEWDEEDEDEEEWDEEDEDEEEWDEEDEDEEEWGEEAEAGGEDQAGEATYDNGEGGRVADEGLESSEGEAGDGEGEAGDGEGDAGSRDEEQSRLKSIVESLLFATDKPLTIKRLAQLTRERDSERLRVILDALAADYQGRGIVLHDVAGGWQFRTAPDNSQWVQQLIAGRPVRLSRAQLETLAIIAYRQPITRPEIDDIRGVDSGGTLKVLLDRHLIRVLGKKEEPGRPLLYGTTKEFLEFFNLNDLRELPTLREYRELTEDSMRVVERMGMELDDLPGRGEIAMDAEPAGEAAEQGEPAEAAEQGEEGEQVEVAEQREEVEQGEEVEQVEVAEEAEETADVEEAGAEPAEIAAAADELDTNQAEQSHESEPAQAQDQAAASSETGSERDDERAEAS